MKIASFNVNSIRVRQQILLDWLTMEKPDIVCLQELKCQNEQFPAKEFEELGYKLAVHGQKAYNGVALLSRYEMTDIVYGLPVYSDEDGQDQAARAISAVIKGVRVYSLYVPNGNPIDSEKFPYKLGWLERLIRHVREDLLPQETPFILAGDFNICPTDDDCYDPVAMQNDALCQPESRAAWHRLKNLGLWDAWRALYPEPDIGFSYWDYMAGRFQKDQGLRIDHFLLSPAAADRLRKSWIDKAPRRLEKPSDHTPILIEMA